jgi:phage regulator Rha-like protein
MNELMNFETLTMTSQEIADLVESRHDNVRTSIERLAEKGVIRLPAMQDAETINNLGFKQNIKVYCLGKRDSYVVVAQLSPEFTGRLVDRWQELEAREFKTPVFAPALTTHQTALDILQVRLTAGNLLGCPLHLAQIEAVKAARSETGVDFAPLLAFSPAQDRIQDEEVMLEPTELGKAMGWGSAIAANKELAALGLQVKTASGWEPTEAGASLCVRHAWTSGTKSGYNLKWSLASVKDQADMPT